MTIEKNPILIINIADETEQKLWTTKYADFYSTIANNALYTVKTVTTYDAAVIALAAKLPLAELPLYSKHKRAQTPGPPAIVKLPCAVLIVGSGIFDPAYFRLHQLLSSYRGVVVFCANVPVFMQPEQANIVFEKAYGLEWKVGGFHGGSFDINEAFRNTYIDSPVADLQASYRSRGLLLKDVPEEAKLYFMKGEEDCMVALESREEGRGWIGFVGDYSLGKGSFSLYIVQAMIGFATKTNSFDPFDILVLPTKQKQSVWCTLCFSSLSPGSVDCNRCCKAPYCSPECRKYDWPNHKKFSSAPLPDWKFAELNKFVRLFPENSEAEPNDDSEIHGAAIAKLVDSYKLHLRDKGCKQTDIALYSNTFGIFEDHPLVEGFRMWLRGARKAGAVPVWWSEEWERDTVHYATWDYSNDGFFGGLILPGMKGDIYLGRDIDERKYGHGKAKSLMMRKLDKLAGIIAMARLDEDDELW